MLHLYFLEKEKAKSLVTVKVENFIQKRKQHTLQGWEAMECYVFNRS